MSDTATIEAPETTPAAALDTLPTITSSNFVDSIEAAFGGIPEPVIPVPDTVEPEPEKQEPTKPAEPTAPEVTEVTEPVVEDPLNELNEIEDTTKDWTPEAARRFKELKTQNKEFKARLQELETQLKQTEQVANESKALAENPEYQELQKRVQEYETKMIVSRLEESYAFKQAVAEPLNELAVQADTIAQRHSINSDDLFEAIALEDSAAQDERLSELLVDVPERDRAKIYRIIDEVAPILKRREELVSNAEAALREAEELEQEQAKAQLREKATARKDAASKVLDTVKSKIPFITTVDGLDLEAITAHAAETDPSLLDPVQGAYQAMSGKILPKLVPYVMELQKEIDALTDKLAAYAQADPKTGGGSGTEFSSSKPATEGGFLEAITAQLGGR